MPHFVKLNALSKLINVRVLLAGGKERVLPLLAPVNAVINLDAVVSNELQQRHYFTQDDMACDDLISDKFKHAVAETADPDEITLDFRAYAPYARIKTAIEEMRPICKLNFSNGSAYYVDDLEAVFDSANKPS